MHLNNDYPYNESFTLHEDQNLNFFQIQIARLKELFMPQTNFKSFMHQKIFML
jgi:hypothetical protein